MTDCRGAAALSEALEIAVALREGGRLAPVDGWMSSELEARLARVSAQAAR